MNTHQVFMVGWEYPPHNSGGLGVACEGMTQALAQQNTQIYFTLPYLLPQQLQHMDIISCQMADSYPDALYPPFSAYASDLSTLFKKKPHGPIELNTLPQSDMEHKVNEYAEYVVTQGKKRKKNFDVIHAHDWMAFPAAMKLQEKTDKPFIAHVHSTEYDRIPSGYGSHYITNTEYVGMQRADKVIAVSYFTKRILIEKYGVDPKKIEVVHNGIHPIRHSSGTPEFAAGRPVVVFMGRLTAQKGAPYFLELAESVLKKIPEALFIVAGNGDQYHSLLFKSAHQRLSASVIFTGFLRDHQRENLLNRADVFVMPSLSEPFGLVALEAAQRNTPVIVSSNSGVKEILPSAIQADFWDIHKMSTNIVELVNNPSKKHTIIQNQNQELQHATWEKAAQEIQKVYAKVA